MFVVALCLCGAWVGLAESLWVLLFDGGMFLSQREWGRYAVVAVASASALVMAVGIGATALVRGLRVDQLRSPRPEALAGFVTAPVTGYLLWLLTDGRRVRDLGVRPWAIAGLAVLAGWVLFKIFQRLAPRLRSGRALGLGLGAVGLATLLLAVDSQMLRRLYPAFHWALAGSVLALAVLAAVAVRGFLSRVSMWHFFAACLVPLSAVLLLPWLLSAPNVRFAVEAAAPLTGKLAMLGVPSQASALYGQQGPQDQQGQADEDLGIRSGAAGVQLSGRDVLLITVDALRADRLAAYGGTGLTPAMDRLAREGVVFERAYTTTPHTSYAMSSLMTGKYLREVFALSETEGEHATLADVVRRYGYRTAAFYPPALFFVDSARFTRLRDRQLGFEYARVMFSTAQERVTELAAYLEKADGEHPVLAWVHLFEPHEPYEPAAEFHRGDSPQALYDGEVAQVDSAVAQLLALMKAHRKTPPLVVLTADHGEEFQDHGGYRHGTTLFDEQVRVPLIVAAQGGIEPGTSVAATDNVDVVPTILSALGMPRDARMRGDDLTPVLSGSDRGLGLRAFATVGKSRMASDSQYKLVCEVGRPCRLFDLVSDPGERRDVAADKGERARALRRALSVHSASIAEHEVIALGGTAFPEVLSRARLGDRDVGPLLVPLLSDSRPEIRAEAALACADVGYATALAVLLRLGETDNHRGVRSSAALAALELGALDVLGQVQELLLNDADGLALRRRAAFALAEVSGHLTPARVQAVVQALTALAQDDSAEEPERLAAVTWLARLAGSEQVQPLIGLLSNVRLRPAVAVAMGDVGTRLNGKQAGKIENALLAALAVERYPEARAAEVSALIGLGHRTVADQVIRFLGTQSSLPGGLVAARRLGVLGSSRLPGGAWETVVERGDLVEGAFRCGDGSCVLEGQGRVHLQALAGRRKKRFASGALLVVAFEAGSGAVLTVGSTEVPLPPGQGQVSVPVRLELRHRPDTGDRGTPLVVTNAKLQLLALAAAAQDVPPPEPEPWDAGLPAEP